MQATIETREPAAESLEFVCSEIWGGNRPIDRPIRAPGVRGRLYSSPCGGDRGGDVHYMSVCGSGLLTRICVADVAGHGDAVASVSQMLHRLLRRYMNRVDQRRVLQDLNRALEGQEKFVLATAAAFSYYAPRGKLWYSYAGHPPAWFFDHREHAWERLLLEPVGSRTLANLPFSVDAGTQYLRGMRRVRPGDRLLILTDGVLEAPSPTGELFGDARVSALLDQQRGADADTVVARLLDAIRGFSGSVTFRHDDVTVSLIDFVRGPRGPAVWTALCNRVMRRRGNTARLDAAAAS